MKRTVVFLLSLLLLAAVSISGTGNIAFAHPSSSTPEVAVLICQPVITSPAPAISFPVVAFSNATSVPISAGNDCATDLLALKNAGLVIKDIKVLNTTPPSVVYTLVNGWYGW